MSSPAEDPLEPLRRAPLRSVRRDLGARVGTLGEARFARGRGGRASDALSVLERVGVPVALAGTVVVYIAWAIAAASALHR